ncbi:Outer membrane protein OmpA [Pseudarcicella hirudinis]|uniref:Outer membrane protein OmpA n=1 Tax=Pseudarcicella hirudinis TaxID=1079859 RepID=A0A1I5RZ36_9BACT|nr:OmpA family protein [Pseudarcicella hirudinis]SFP63788.1 Outer membrane protein OmpA [Pseudarcicella hirudinis]
MHSRVPAYFIRGFFILSTVFFTSQTLKAQTVLSSSNKKAVAAYEKGLSALQNRKIDEAFSEFEEAIEKDDLFAEPYFQLGKLYEQSRQFGNAILNYEKAINAKENSSVKEMASQQVGLLYLKKGEYESALVNLERGKPSVTASNAKRYQLRLDNCKFALETLKTPLVINPVELPDQINAFKSQYFPALTADREKLIYTGQDPETGDENLYISDFKEGNWSAPQSLSDKINSTQNEGTASISADGRILVFTSCNGRKSFGSCDLFISFKQGTEWSNPQNLGSNINSPEWDSQPSLSADGRTLYFVSDRQGGLGKRDIWVSKSDSTGQWSKAKNLGNIINTYEDDLSPFIHANGKTLFFSSEGHIGMGGLDLYFSENLGTDTWKKPENLGYPINTHEDQVALFITADGKKGYYSVEKEQNNKRRAAKLVEIDLPEVLQNKFKRTFYLKGNVSDALTKQKIKADIELINLKTNELIGKFSSDPQSGNYISVLTNGGEYGVFVSKAGYFFKSLNFDFSQQNAKDKILDIQLEPIQKNAHEVLNNIFFDSGKWDIKPESVSELDKLIKLLKANSSISVEISGHTDDVGKEADNLALSKKRAQSVVDYLAKNGVNIAKIKIEGYGKSRPIAENTSEENRKLNRRIEIKFF